MRWLRACGGIGALCGIAMTSACLERQLAPLSPCLISTVSDTVSANNIDSVDVLFMVDNSNSMRQEQAALVRELPEMVRVLSSGDRDNDGVQDFRPVSLRLGVVSSDLGLPGIGGVCSSGLGDNGVLQHVSNPSANPTLSCQSSYPPFLSFSPQSGPGAAAAVQQIANDFACISTLGTLGCGFEQQLESALKALWPSDNHVLGQDMVRALGQFPGFVADPVTQQGGTGNGDPFGANAGFLHNNVEQGLSLIAVILVTDEEDCSSWNLEHFITQEDLLAPDSPLRQQVPNLRCFRNKQNLFPVQRYIDGLKALRPGTPNLVVFGAITGVDPTLVDEAALARVDFNDAAQSSAFYDGILAHPSMQETPNAMGRNLNTSCTNVVDGVLQEAYPPRRIVEVAKGFGANGIVQSICQESFAPAMNRIIETIIGNLPTVCLPRKLVRDVNGMVDCRVVWDLPQQSAVAPTTCEDPRFVGVLSRPAAGRRQRTDDGLAICEVNQLPVGACTPSGLPDDPCTNGTGPSAQGQGWYHDDFSAETANCPGADKQLISFSTGARPPNGVLVRLECTSQVQNLVATRSDVQVGVQPNLGDECDTDFDCAVSLLSTETCLTGQRFRQDVGGACFDIAMFCHPTERQCVQACGGSGDCPPAWKCDLDGVESPLSETNNIPICVNPTCSE